MDQFCRHARIRREPIHFVTDCGSLSRHKLSPDGRLAWLLVDFTKQEGRVTLWITQTWQAKATSIFSWSEQRRLFSRRENCIGSVQRPGHSLSGVFQIGSGCQIGSRRPFSPPVMIAAGAHGFTWDSRQIVADGSWKEIHSGIAQTQQVTIWDVPQQKGRMVATKLRISRIAFFGV